MLKILVNSYTCCPNMGSEQGMGWNWIVSLARYCVMYVITEGEYRGEIEAWMRDADNADVAKNIHFYYLPIGGDDEAECDKIRKMCWNQGDWRFYKYYKEWQKKVADKAKSIINDEERKVLSGETDHGIDVLHQLNMIGFREPGYLARISKEYGIPLFWGPIGGLKKYPYKYASGIKMKIFILLKNTISDWQIKHSRRVVETLNQSSLLISSIPDSYDAIKKYHGLESVIIPETGCFLSQDKMYENTCINRFYKDVLTILWVGKFDFRKRLDIALASMKQIEKANVKLKVFGTGNDKQIKEAEKLTEKFGIESSVEFVGNQSNDVVKDEMRKADLFFFTSVNEDTSTVVLEAVSNNLPVLCFDCCGMSAVINDKVGIKIPLSNPEQSVKDFASAIESLYNDRERLKQMSDNCYVHAEELSWDNKAKQMVHLYEEAIKKNMRN